MNISKRLTLKLKIKKKRLKKHYSNRRSKRPISYKSLKLAVRNNKKKYLENSIKLIFRVVINNPNTLLVLRALQCSRITFNFMTILLIFITNLSACTITTKRRRIYDVTLAHYVTSLNILKSYEDKRN